MSEFFEQQEGNMCALHAVRNLMGNDSVTREHFENVVDQCVEETKLDRTAFATETGNYNTDVIHKVLDGHGFQVERVGRPIHTYLHDPQLKGFVVHDSSRSHYTSVKFNGYQLKHYDSMKTQPEYIGQNTLEDTSHWTLLAVRGKQKPFIDPKLKRELQSL